MRIALLASLAFAIAGCPSDPVTDAGTDTPAVLDTPAVTDAGRDTPAELDAPAETDAPTETDAPAETDAPTDAPVAVDAPVPVGEPPVITRIAWATDPACVASSPTDYTVDFTVTDADTAAGMLTFSGSVGGCTGMLNAASVTIRCPNLAPYGGTVTVRDPEGNADTAMFTIAPCTDGMSEP